MSTAASTSASATASASSSAALFRRLTWNATVPICVRLAEGTKGASGAGAYYMHAPRHTYLPLLIPEIRENLVALALSEEELGRTDEGEWWFEEEPRTSGEGGGSAGHGEAEGDAFESQGAIRWQYPLDLVQLLSLISTPLPPMPTLTHPSSPPVKPPMLRLVLHLSNPPLDRLLPPSPLPLSSGATPTPLSLPPSQKSTTTSRPPAASSSSSSTGPAAGDSSLRPGAGPGAGSAQLIETARLAWLNSTKAADFVRFRSTARVTGLRRAEIEGAWEAVARVGAGAAAGAGAGASSGGEGRMGVGGPSVASGKSATASAETADAGMYEAFGRIAGKLWPVPLPPSSSSSGSARGAGAGAQGAGERSRGSSVDPTGGGGGGGGIKQPDSAYTVRAIPVRVYLPDGAPVIQEVVPPLGQDGKPTTLLVFLRTHLPLLFPAPPESKPTSASTVTGTEHDAPPLPFPLAVPLIQGIEAPPDAELAWLCACVCGADGWLRIGVRLRGGWVQGGR